jgi:hypothetical protein
VLRISLAFLVASLLGCDALAENPGRNPSTEPTPQIALDCEVVATGSEMTGMPVESGSEREVAGQFLARHGLRAGDRLAVEHGPWEPGIAAVTVTRGNLTVASVELEQAGDGWVIRAFSWCDEEFGAR